MRALLVAVAAMALGAAAIEAAAAQESVRITGRVVENESGVPLGAADVIVRARDDRYLRGVVTSEDGRFEVVVHQVDAVTLYASRLGYTKNSTPLLWFDGHAYFDVEIRLDREAILLAPLEVLARSESTLSPVLAGFRHRLSGGSGVYITRAQIERRRPMYVTDLLADIPGVHLTSSGSGSRRTVSMSRGTRQGCPIQLFVDGLLMSTPVQTRSGVENPGATIDDYVSPLSVEGIEVYRGLSTVPAEFLTPDAECGVIAVWTRRGSR